MTDRQSDNETRLDGEAPEVVTEGGKRFWSATPADTDDVKTDDADDGEPPSPAVDQPVATDDADDAVESVDADREPADASEDAASWLMLSRSVDTRSATRRATGPRRGLASLFPKARGGRVVVRGPVDGGDAGDLARIEEEVERLAEASVVEPMPEVGASDDGLAEAVEPRVFAEPVHDGLDADMDEPLPMAGEAAPLAAERYLPDDVYVEANPYDIAEGGTDDADAWAGHDGWIDEELAARAGESDGMSDGDVANAYEQAQPPARRFSLSSRHTRVVLLVSLVAVALVAVYVAGINQVRGTFLPRTTIGDCDVSGLTLEEAEQALTAYTQGYVLDISVGAFSTSVEGASVSLDRDELAIAQEALREQSPLAWPFAMLFGAQADVDEGITYDNVKFDKQVSDAIDAYHQQTLPTDDAQVAYDDKTQTYALVGNVKGQALDKQTILSVAHGYIATMRSSASLSPDSAMHAARLDDLPQYANAVSNANAVRDATIPILVEGEQVAVCDPTLIRSWVTVSDEPAVVVDTTAVRKWCDKTLGPLTYETDEWGELFLDTDEFVNQFSQRLANGDPSAFEAPTFNEFNREGTSRQQAYAESPWNKELGRYIDVDLKAQFARLFDESGNVLWESAFVSGDMYQGRQTITGTYDIYQHLTSQVLIGLDYNGDGQPDYESFVNFWMPFYGGYGLHDATWRDSFGGDLYQYDGSHGCINLPYDKAEELYNLVDVGDTVYVHE